MADRHIPMYQQVFDELKQQIMDKVYVPDQAFPGLDELTARFQTSAITVRRALTELAGEGLIYRIRGKGTFVSPEDQLSAAGRKVGLLGLKRIYMGFPGSTPLLNSDKYFSDLMAGIDSMCEQLGVELYYWDYLHKPDFPEEDNTGIILVPDVSLPIEVLKRWKEENRPFITVHFYYPHLQIPYVIVDNLTGGYLATQHLLTLGHKRIGIILTGNSLYDLNQEFSLRLQGYKLALQLNNIPFDEKLVIIKSSSSEREEMGYEGMTALLDTENPPTAVFATSDVKAMGCIKACHDRGISVPEQMSIVGYDDLRISPYIYPGLTTVNQNTFKMGTRAVEILCEYWDKEESSGGVTKEEIVPQLVVRGSTAGLVIR